MKLVYFQVEPAKFIVLTLISFLLLNVFWSVFDYTKGVHHYIATSRIIDDYDGIGSAVVFKLVFKEELSQNEIMEIFDVAEVMFPAAIESELIQASNQTRSHNIFILTLENLLRNFPFFVALIVAVALSVRRAEYLPPTN